MILAPLLLAAAQSAAMDTPLPLEDGRIGTLEHGRYTCGRPGDAAGPSVHALPELTFTVVGGSSYQSERGGGTYLLAGNTLTFTRGPLKDMRYQRTTMGLWREIAPDGSAGAIRCSRVG